MTQRGVRLSAGSLKGRALSVPPGVRPTEARVREAFLDILGPEIRGQSLLDLFAGCGAVGLEALSRGAARVCQVDSAGATVRLLESAYRELGLEGITCLQLQLPDRIAALAPNRFDWVFADPPYDFARYAELVAALPAVLAPGGEAVLEHEAKLAPPEPTGALTRVESRRYGGTVLSFYRASESD